jgi:hypothetical protein
LPVFAAVVLENSLSRQNVSIRHTLVILLLNSLAIQQRRCVDAPQILDFGDLVLKASYYRALGAFVLFSAWSSFTASGADIKTVFVIAMENHNWTQPTQVPGRIQQIYGSPNAPFINSLVNGQASAIIDGAVVSLSQKVAYATAYHSVLATPGRNNPHIHPSEPNYIWAEPAPTLACKLITTASPPAAARTRIHSCT